MSDHREVRVENPMLCAQFTDWLLRQGAPLPWNVGAIIGEIVDAEDRVVVRVDVSYSREKAGQISAAILTTVNTCGGFKVSCRERHDAIRLQRARQGLPALPRRRL